MNILLLPILGSITFSIIMLLMPLMSVPSYESAEAMNIFIILFYCYYTYKLLKIRFDEDFNFINITSSMILFIIPLIFLTISGLFRGFCPGTDGWIFYFVNLLPLLILLTSLISFFRGINTKPRTAAMIWISIILLTLVYNIFLLMSEPQVRFCSIIWGYFSGPVYDEDVVCDDYVLLCKGLSLVLSAMLLLSHLKRRLLLKYILIILLIFPAVILLKNINKFENNRQAITEQLGSIYKTPHFEIVYPPDQEWSKEISTIGHLHEYYYTQITSELGISEDIRIRSFIFRDEDEKRLLTGAGRTQIAKPWLKEIYITPPTLTDPRLKHEISHIIVGRLVKSPLNLPGKFSGIIPNMALAEGISVALEPDTNVLSLHQKAATLLKKGKLPSFEDLFNPARFYSSSGSIAYSAAGSFIRFLIDSYGIENFKRLLHNEDFKTVYKEDISQILIKYTDFLKQIDVSPQEEYWASIIYRSKGLIEKRCPHEIAVFKKQLSQSNKKGVSTISSDISNLLMNYCEEDNEIISELAKSMILRGDLFRAEEFIKKNMQIISNAYYYTLLLEIYTNILIFQNRLQEAYQIISWHIKDLPDSDARRNFEIKKYLINSQDFELLRGLFSPERIPSSRIGILLRGINEKKNPIAYYLLGKLFFNVKDYRSTIEYIERFIEIFPSDKSIPKSTYIEAVNILLTTAIVTGDINLGMSVIEKARDFINTNKGLLPYHTKRYNHLTEFFLYLKQISDKKNSKPY